MIYKAYDKLNFYLKISVIVLVTSCIVISITLAALTKSKVAILITIFGFVFGSGATVFLVFFVININKLYDSLRIYSITLLPVYKYCHQTKTIRKSNKATSFFLMFLLILIIWGFVNTLILEIEDRWIGLSISGISLSLFIIFFYFRVFFSNFINKDEIFRIGLTINDIFTCYRCAASITTDFKRIPKKSRTIDMQQDYNRISLGKEIKFERTLNKRSAIARFFCGDISTSEELSNRQMEENLRSVRISQIPKNQKESSFKKNELDDLICITQKKGVAAFSYFLNIQILDMAKKQTPQIEQEELQKQVTQRDKEYSMEIQPYIAFHIEEQVNRDKFEDSEWEEDPCEEVKHENSNFPRIFPQEKDVKNVNIVWLPVKDIKPEYELQLFSDTVSHSDITQGKLGNCWLISALTSICVLRPDLIIRIFHPLSRKISESGIYRLRFYPCGERKEIEIDDIFPCRADTGSPLCCIIPTDEKMKIKELWPLLIEKGMAKIYGGYQCLDGGSIDTAFADLTGGMIYKIYFDDDLVRKSIEEYNHSPMDSLFGRMNKYMEAGYLLGASIIRDNDNPLENQLVPNHSYAILDVINYDGKHLIQLKNPWGHYEWTGAWSDDSPKWNKRIRKYINQRQIQRQQSKSQFLPSNLQFGIKREAYSLNPKDDGVFWMNFEDFSKNFSTLFACYFFNTSWIKHRFDGAWGPGLDGGREHPNVFNNPLYSISIESKEAKIFILLFQIKKSLAEPNKAIGFEIFSCKDAKKVTRESAQYECSFFYSGEYEEERQVSFECHLEKGEYILVPSTYYKNIHLGYRLFIWQHQDDNISFSQIY